MISRIGYNECTEQLTDDPDGDMVLYEDYQALEAENKRLREALEKIYFNGNMKVADIKLLVEIAKKALEMKNEH